mmetsp:Transcript_15335/g.29076  ORF Transcript_15335/g.29076 Transcript_15335/m.29076 type:complete len:110 (-) Transcript_15335:65-394(-)|eukprot:scaffold6091_cov164-Amphora_coffeaeformis.AAC.3
MQFVSADSSSASSIVDTLKLLGRELAACKNLKNELEEKKKTVQVEMESIDREYSADCREKILMDLLIKEAELRRSAQVWKEMRNAENNVYSEWKGCHRPFAAPHHCRLS